MDRAPAEDAIPRQRILAAARRRFETYGYRRTSIAEIARAAGIAVGTIYRYFPGKEAVFLAVVEELNDTWLEESRRALDGPGTAVDRMRRLGAASIQFAAENALITAIAMRDSDIVFAPLLERLYDEMARQNVAMMADVIRDGIREGSFRDIDPERAAYVLFMAGGTLSIQQHHPYAELMPVFETIVYEGLLKR
jgi:TetR/AcrR family transcriptional regulator, fatty acid metabolism regulator protein